MATTLILSAILMASMFGMIWTETALVQAKKLAATAPKDVQAAIREHPERFPKQHALGWKLLILCAAAFLGAFFYGGWDGIRQGYGFWQFFGRFLTMLYLMKAFDIICLDWLLLSKSHFFQHYFPETEGCAGYKHFGFNRRQQLTRIILFPFLSLLLAWLCTIVA
mgnify:CR=1 FL=1